MRGFSLERSWRTGGTGNTQYNTSGTFVVPFGKQFTQISGAGVPGTPASFTPASPASYYAGAPAVYYAGAPAVYYAGATGPNNTILGVTFPGGTAGNPGAYVNPTTIDTNYTYVYPNSYAIPNLSGGYVIISVR